MCPIYTHNGASAKFSTNSHETDNRVFKKSSNAQILLYPSVCHLMEGYEGECKFHLAMNFVLKQEDWLTIVFLSSILFGDYR